MRRAIPENNLAYPVLIAFPGSSGSGFYLTTETRIFLVTCAHVLRDGERRSPPGSGFIATSYSCDSRDPVQNVLAIDYPRLQTAGLVRIDAGKDVAVVQIAAVEAWPALHARYLDGVFSRSLSSRGIVAASLDRLKGFDEVLVGNDVVTFGYPASLGVAGFPQIDPARPLLRKGIVAGLNPALRTIILDCRLDIGNSGGPVLELAEPGAGEGKIIGIVREFVPATFEAAGTPTVINSGYSVAVPADCILDLVALFLIATEPSMRKLVVAALAVFMLFFAVASPVLFPRPSPVTRAAFDRVRVGMPLADVEGVFGVPAGDHRTQPRDAFGTLLDRELIVSGYHMWQGDEGDAYIFTRRGVVTRKTFCERSPAGVGPLELAAWRLGRWHERYFGPGR